MYRQGIEIEKTTLTPRTHDTPVDVIVEAPLKLVE
jgi:hypothetical protein